MKQRDFDELVERIETRYADKPGRLRLRTALLVALGFAGFLFWFLLLGGVGAVLFLLGVTLEGEAVALLIAGAAIVLTLGIVQTLQFVWIPVDPGKGRVLTREETPVLFECLDRLKAQTGATKLDRVETNWDFNAGVREVPRLGFFGWPRHHLQIGLSLLETLSPAESVAVLAHELAHLSARHDRFGMWIYRLRRTWGKLIEQISKPAKTDTGRALRPLLIKMVNWYWPLINAYAFVLSRSDEYVADRVSAECIGTTESANALWKIACFGQHLNRKFWSDLWQRAAIEPNVPEDIGSELLAFLRETPASNDADRWCEEAVQSLTGHADTHPRFADRARALGLSPQQFLQQGFPRPANPSAAEFLLGRRLAQIREETSALWRTEAKSAWQARHRQAANLQRQIKAIEVGPAAGEPAADILWEKAQNLLGVGRSEEAESLLRQLLAMKPTHSAANLALGTQLLERRDGEGVLYLQRILDLDDDGLVPAACAALTHYDQSIGDVAGAQQVSERLHRYQVETEAAHKERAQIRPTDSFRAHGLAPTEMNDLVAILRGESELDGAWLVQKDLAYFPNQRLFVLVVRTAANTWGRSDSSRDLQLVNRLIPKLRLPGRRLVIGANGTFRKLAKKVMNSDDSRIV